MVPTPMVRSGMSQDLTLILTLTEPVGLKFGRQQPWPVEQ